MLPAAGVTPAAQIGMNLFLIGNRCRFRRHALENVRWLCDADERRTPAETKRRFTVVRLRFNAALTQFDPFSEAITHPTSVHGRPIERDLDSVDGRPRGRRELEA